MNENKKVARNGGEAAKQARKVIENQTGKSVISPKNARELKNTKQISNSK